MRRKYSSLDPQWADALHLAINSTLHCGGHFRRWLNRVPEAFHANYSQFVSDISISWPKQMLMAENGEFLRHFLAIIGLNAFFAISCLNGKGVSGLHLQMEAYRALNRKWWTNFENIQGPIGFSGKICCSR